MERFKRTFSFRKKKDHVPEASKPHQWQEDEKKVRDGTCSFQVRYLGCVEVFESRGIQVCEEAVKALKSMRKGRKVEKYVKPPDKNSAGAAKRLHRSLWSRVSIRKKKKSSKEGDKQSKGKYQRAVLYVSGDALRVVDEISKGLIVDQTIEKVSFCAPDRNHEKGFAYICRDGTTRRWMCHGFLAVKESGERMSHAVGCAFAVCLEKKQKREKESVSVTFNDKGTSFTRMGSFRQTTLTERMADPQSAIIPEPVTVPVSEDGGQVGPASTPAPVNAVERPRASADMLNRQASFRGFGKLADNSPFKKQYSLRLNELPSNLARQQQLTGLGRSLDSAGGQGRVEVIPEVSPSKEQADIADLCNQIEGLNTALGTDAAASPFAQPVAAQQAAFSTPQHTVQVHTHAHTQPAVVAAAQPTQPPPPAPAQPAPASHIPTSSSSSVPGGPQPIRQTNPWETPPAFRHASPAESWLQSSVLSSSPTPPAAAQPQGQSPFSGIALPGATTTGAAVNGATSVNSVQPQSVVLQQQTSVNNGYPQTVVAAQNNGYPQTPPPVAARAPPLTQRSQTVDSPASAQAQWYNKQKAPTLKELQHTNKLHFMSQQQQQIQQQQNGGISAFPAPAQSSPQPATSPWSAQPLGPTSSDPFDAAWATKSPNVKPASSNPFQSGDSVTQTFKMQL